MSYATAVLSLIKLGWIVLICANSIYTKLETISTNNSSNISGENKAVHMPLALHVIVCILLLVKELKE